MIWWGELPLVARPLRFTIKNSKTPKSRTGFVEWINGMLCRWSIVMPFAVR